MALLKSTFKRWNGSAWDIHYFRTSADVIDETESYKVMTGAERTAIATYLTTFNAANKLLKLDGSGLIPEALIPGGLGYLKINNPTFTGTLTGPSAILNGDSLAGLYYKNTAHGIIFEQGKVSVRLDNSNIFELIDNATTGAKFSTQVEVATPTEPSNAATKGYVDGLVGTGTRPVNPVKAATTGNITLSGLQEIDGYTVIAGDRVLVKDQTTASQNGIYTASATGWSKVAADSKQGRLTFVEHGTVNNDSQFYATSDTSWTLFSRVDTIVPGAGIARSGNTISIKPSGVTNEMLAGSIAPSKMAAWASFYDDNWAQVADAQVSKALTEHIGDIYTAIKLLRGTQGYSTANSETIAGAYNLAEVKNRTYIGNSDPGLTGYVAGDLFFQDIV